MPIDEAPPRKSRRRHPASRACKITAASSLAAFLGLGSLMAAHASTGTSATSKSTRSTQSSGSTTSSSSSSPSSQATSGSGRAPASSHTQTNAS